MNLSLVFGLIVGMTHDDLIVSVHKKRNSIDIGDHEK